jgi:hypothetical protein
MEGEKGTGVNYKKMSLIFSFFHKKMRGEEGKWGNGKSKGKG